MASGGGKGGSTCEVRNSPCTAARPCAALWLKSVPPDKQGSGDEEAAAIAEAERHDRIPPGDKIMAASM